jgi:hypothetical protein
LADPILNTDESDEFSTPILVTGFVGIVLVCPRFRTVPEVELSIARIIFSRSPDVPIDEGSM